MVGECKPQASTASAKRDGNQTAANTQRAGKKPKPGKHRTKDKATKVIKKIKDRSFSFAWLELPINGIARDITFCPVHEVYYLCPVISSSIPEDLSHGGECVAVPFYWNEHWCVMRAHFALRLH